MSSSSSRGKCCRFSLDDIMYVTNEFGERKILGHGGEGFVYLAHIYLGLEKAKTLIAVKHLKAGYSDQKFEQEIETVSRIQHDHLISLLGYCEESGQKILLYEYMAKGSLHNYVQEGSDQSTPLSWKQWLGICLGVARGLQHLHKKTEENPMGITHRDVKPANILLHENWLAKLSDFGSLIKLSSAASNCMSTRVIGTAGYMAPEYCLYLRVTTKIDVFAFGVVLFQVLCRKMPWARPSENDTFFLEEDENLALWAEQSFHASFIAEISDDSVKAFTTIIGKSLQVNPRKRPTMDVVVKDLEMILLGLQNDGGVFKPYKSVMSMTRYDSFDVGVGGKVSFDGYFDGAYDDDGYEDENLKICGLECATSKRWRRPIAFFSWIVSACKGACKCDIMYLTLPIDQRCRRFSPEEIQGGTNNFDEQKVIGQGGSARVYLADIYLGLGKEKTLVAVKVLKSKYSIAFEEDIIRISRIRHPHIVSMIGYCNQLHDHEAIVYEYMTNGSLSDFLSKSSNVSLSWQQWLKICIGAARGLQHLHSEGIIHRDVSPGNILLDEYWVAKVSGFVSLKLPTRDAAVMTGTVGYYAPEYIKHRRLTPKVDVYAFGVILFQGLCRKMPWDCVDESFWPGDDDDDEDFEVLAKENVYSDTKKEITDDSLEMFTKIIGASLLPDPSKRPTMNQVVSDLEICLTCQEHYRIMIHEVTG